MLRKLVKQGSCALTITLPASWTKKNGLRAGDEIKIDDNDKALVISIDTKSELKKVSLDINNHSKNKIKFLNRVIHTIYCSGFDEINLNFENKISMSDINKVISNYIGLEIINIMPHNTSLKIFSTISLKDYHFFTNKILITTLVIFDEIISFLKENKMDITSIDEMKRSNIRSRNICMRAINTINNPHGNPINSYMFIFILERIGKAITYLIKYISQNNVKPSQKTIEIIDKTRSMFQSFMGIYSIKDYDTVINKLNSEKFLLLNNALDENEIFNLISDKAIEKTILIFVAEIWMDISSLVSRHLGSLICKKEFET